MTTSTAIDFTGFDIPELRKDLTFMNCNWLLRNLAVRNSDHPRLKQVILQIKSHIRSQLS